MARTSKYQNLNIQPSIAVWRAALYLRLSREDGDKLESESISSQKMLLIDYLTKRPEITVVDTYIDDGYSGTNFDRPDFLRMFEDIRSGKVNCVIVKDLSRFGRNYVESGKYLEVVFPTLNTRFISVNDNVDSIENPSSLNSVIVPFKNIINDEYCRDISQKVRSSLTVKRKQGQFIGSFAPYGYQKDPADRHKLVIDEDAADVVRLIYRLFLSGQSIAGISRHLSQSGVKNIADYKKSKGLNYRAAGKANTAGFWCDFSVRRILTSRVYCGDMVQKKTETVSYKVRVCRNVPSSQQIAVLNTHQPIISRDTFKKVQSLLNRDTRALGSGNLNTVDTFKTMQLFKGAEDVENAKCAHNAEDAQNADFANISRGNLQNLELQHNTSLANSRIGQLGLFAGFVKCFDCRRAMQKKTIKLPYKTYDYFICSTYKKVSHDICTKHTIRADVLENTVLTVIKKYIELAVDMQRLIEEINNSPLKNSAEHRVKQAIVNAQKEKAKAVSLLTDLYPDFKSGLICREQYMIQKERYENKLASIEKNIEKLKIELDGSVNGVDSNLFIVQLKKHKNITVLNREILAEFVDNIYVHEGGGIEIAFKFSDAYENALTFVNDNKVAIADFEDSKRKADKITKEGKQLNTFFIS